MPILVIWLYGTLVLAKAIGVRDHPPRVDPRVVVPVIHMKGAGVGGAIAKYGNMPALSTVLMMGSYSSGSNGRMAGLISSAFTWIGASWRVG